MWSQLLDKLVECEDTCFLEAVVGDVDGVGRIVPDFLGNAPGRDVHVLVLGHRGTQIIILDIDAHVAGAIFGIRDCAIDVDFGGKHGYGWQAGVSGVVDGSLFSADGCCRQSWRR